MRYLFVPGVDLSRDSIDIEGADAHHLLNVLRIRCGDTLTLLDNAGGAALAEASEIGKRTATARIIGPAICPSDPPVHITVAQALGKGDKFEQVIQHSTEVGASAFVPLLTERTVVKIDPRDADAKRARWSQIAKGAAEQSGRGRIPTIEHVATLRDLTSHFPSFDRVLLLHPPAGEGTDAGANGRHLDTPALPHSHTVVIVGPEGGFSDGELAMAEEAGAVRTAIGPYTLRTETAALVAIARILYAAERG
jgi:16S rRNA (uracil1498-N3)-methyltransferase